MVKAGSLSKWENTACDNERVAAVAMIMEIYVVSELGGSLLKNQWRKNYGWWYKSCITQMTLDYGDYGISVRPPTNPPPSGLGQALARRFRDAVLRGSWDLVSRVESTLIKVISRYNFRYLTYN